MILWDIQQFTSCLDYFVDNFNLKWQIEMNFDNIFST